MIRKGHLNALSYPISFFITAVKEARSEELVFFKNLALYGFIAKNADYKYIEKLIKQEEISTPKSGDEAVLSLRKFQSLE